MQRFEMRSTIDAPAEQVWARAVTEEGINDELMPIFRMTMPKALRGRTVADVEPGTRPGRAWILLFGVVPVDYDDLGIAELEDGHFLERSTMLSMREWEHDRTVSPVDGADWSSGACIVHDRLGFELRRPLAWIPGMAALFRIGFSKVFAHRHRRLARHFGPNPA